MSELRGSERSTSGAPASEVLAAEVSTSGAPAAEVLVVGAGPTGLLLAGDLAAAGIACTLLERRTNESNLTRAFAMHARTLETLDARGLADELIGTGQRVPTLRLLGRADIDLSGLPTRFPYLLVTPQYQTERVLAERARGLGVRIETGVEVVAVRQDPDGVEVDVRVADGAVRTRRAAYLVGTDGMRSTVRTALGLPFPGRSAVRSVMLADVRLSRTPTEVLTVNAAGDAFGFIAPFGDGWYRVIAWSRRDQRPEDAPVELAEVRAVIERTLGTDYGMRDARWFSRFHSDERQVPRYRVGRVFLAGDAAHVHSPAGGQGMNTGLQDAANLGWKLAAALRGRAPEGLLDTYHGERYPVGRMVLRMSGGLLRVGMSRPWLLPEVRALVTAASRVGPIGRRAAAAVSGIGIRYPRPPGAHPLVGRRVPDLALRGGRLYEALRDGRLVLVAPPGTAPVEGVRLTAPVLAGPTLLVRPDGYVAWATDRPDPAAIRSAVGHWTRPTP
jgi:2-polyprenyl-6-methoxyphenol hydroxylase-like FAD-dependent oxidoreductase